MRRVLLLLVVVGIAFVACGVAAASVSVALYTDSAPNSYGSTSWTTWWSQTKVDVVAGNFTNLRTGTYPGTTWIDPYDEIVYSTGDLGKRLHWIYWVPGATKSGLTNNFQVKWSIDWEGEAWTYENNDWALDGPEIGWAQPTSWEDYYVNNQQIGVIGSFGFAWWSTDNDAPPLSTDGNLYNEVDRADIDALRREVFAYQTYALGQVRYRESESEPWQYVSIQNNLVPEPATIVVWSLLGGLAVGLGWWRRRRPA